MLNQIESATGGRFHPNFDRIGGLKDDLPKGWIDDTKAAMEKVRDFCDEMDDLVIGNEIFQARTRGIGVIPADVALSYGLSGANLRASGVDWDLRRDDALRGLVYDQLDWKVWTHPDGDSFARYWVRLQEIREAVKHRRPAARRPARPGRSWPRCPASSRCPRARPTSQTENPLGAMGYYVVSKGDLGPFRVKIRTRQLQQHLDRAVGAARRLRARRHHDPRQPLLHPRRHRPMTVARRPRLATGSRRSLRGRSGVLVAVLLPAGTFVYLFLFKMMSFMQSRLGPMEAGPYGSLQLLAEVGKWLQKEDIIPERADRILFKLAPYRRGVARSCSSTSRCPFGPDAWFADLDVGIFYALAVSSVSVIGILMAGWASANKYSLMGGLRAAGQLIAYELPMVLAVVGVVIQAGTLNMQGIVVAQADGEIFGFGGIGNPYILTQFVGLR